MSTRPVHLLTGFLGSGKTTLLSRVLRQPAFADTAVIINELGDVGLDHMLVDRGTEDGVVLLDSGCLCCALGSSLQETLESLHFRSHRGELPAFARVVVETTGVADPGPIAATLALDSAIARHYRLGSIVTVVDAVHGSAQLQRFAEARHQVAMADRIVVSKCDVAAADVVRSLDMTLAQCNPHAVRIVAASGQLSANEVFIDLREPQALAQLASPEFVAVGHDAAHRHDPEEPAGAAHDHLAAGGIVSTTLHLAAPLAWSDYAAWVQWLQRAVGDRLLRMKGAARMTDGSVQALHGVLRLFSAPAPLRDLPAALGHGVVVVITQDAGVAMIDEIRRRLGGM